MKTILATALALALIAPAFAEDTASAPRLKQNTDDRPAKLATCLKGQGFEQAADRAAYNAVRLKKAGVFVIDRALLVSAGSDTAKAEACLKEAGY